jgi:glutaconate CoA-transferase subunit B
VTPLCVFQRVDGTLTVESIHPSSSANEVRAATEFAVDVGVTTLVTPQPTLDELAALASVDPAGIVAAEFASR